MAAGHMMEQRWFAGVHANVGGGYANDGLANNTFHWILKGAEDLGLVLDHSFIAHYKPSAADTMYESYSIIYATLDVIRLRVGDGRRSIPANACIDRTAIDRINTAPQHLGRKGERPTQAYRPENLIEFLAKQPDLAAYLRNIGLEKGLESLPADVRQRIVELKELASAWAVDCRSAIPKLTKTNAGTELVETAESRR